MKQISLYISEGLRINKNTKITNEYTKEILNFLYGEPDDCDPKEYKAIDNWVKDNKVEKISFVSTEDVLLGYGFEDDDIKEYLDYFKDKDNLELYIDKDDGLYDQLCKKLGDEVWKDQYEHNILYVFNNRLSLKSRFARGYIFIIANEDL